MFADAKVPKIDGIELLRRIKQSPRADTAVVMMSSNGSIPVAVQAVKLGAFDFLKKPIPTEKLRALLSEIQRRTVGRLAAPADHGATRAWISTGRSSAASPAIERLKRMIRIASQTDANVLIHGETGVGKDLVASVIHRQSHRGGGPYVKVGCTLLPPSLIESELYGHEEGSFTGADQYRRGRFEMADGGTIYLDDVDDISVGPAGQTAAGDRGEGLRARRRHEADQSECARPGLHQDQPARQSRRTAPFGRTCTIGWTCCDCAFPRCARDSRTCRR